MGTMQLNGSDNGFNTSWNTLEYKKMRIIGYLLNPLVRQILNSGIFTVSICLQPGFWTINRMLGVVRWSHIEFNQAYLCHHSNVCTITQYYPTNWHQELILHPPKLNIATYQKWCALDNLPPASTISCFGNILMLNFTLVTSLHKKKNMFSHQSYPTTVAGILNNPFFWCQDTRPQSVARWSPSCCNHRRWLNLRWDHLLGVNFFRFFLAKMWSVPQSEGEVSLVVFCWLFLGGPLKK